MTYLIYQYLKVTFSALLSTIMGHGFESCGVNYSLLPCRALR